MLDYNVGSRDCRIIMFGQRERQRERETAKLQGKFLQILEAKAKKMCLHRADLLWFVEPKMLTELLQLYLSLAALFTHTLGVKTVVLGPDWELAIYGATDQT